MALKGQLLFWVFNLVGHAGPTSVLFIFGSLHQAGPDGSVAASSATLKLLGSGGHCGPCDNFVNFVQIKKRCFFLK